MASFRRYLEILKGKGFPIMASGYYIFIMCKMQRCLLDIEGLKMFVKNPRNFESTVYD